VTRFLHNHQSELPTGTVRPVGGHGSALLYSLLHVTGYALPLDQIKQFLNWKHYPGHPAGPDAWRRNHTGRWPGFGNGVGMAISEAHLAARYNRLALNRGSLYLWAGQRRRPDGGRLVRSASLPGQLKLGTDLSFDNNNVTLSPVRIFP